MQSERKAKARQRCIDLTRDITMMERDGEHGSKVWHKAQEALGRAITAYSELGATVAEVAHLGLQRSWAGVTDDE